MHDYYEYLKYSIKVWYNHPWTHTLLTSVKCIISLVTMAYHKIVRNGKEEITERIQKCRKILQTS
jgi:hypothetical protein